MPCSVGVSLRVAASGTVWGEVGGRQILHSRISFQTLVQAFRGGCVHMCRIQTGLPQLQGLGLCSPYLQGALQAHSPGSCLVGALARR